MPQGVAVRVRSAVPRRRKANFVSPWAFAQGLYSIACGSFFPQIFCCAKYLWEPCVFLPLGNGALVPSRSRSTDTPEGVPYFGRARAPPSASGGWASDFVLARRYHVGTRRPLQRDEQSSSLPLLRRSSRAVDAALGHGIARTMGNSEVRAYAETPPGLSAEHTPSPFFPKIFCCAKYLREPFLLFSNGGAGTFSLPLNRHP